MNGNLAISIFECKINGFDIISTYLDPWFYYKLWKIHQVSSCQHLYDLILSFTWLKGILSVLCMTCLFVIIVVSIVKNDLAWILWMFLIQDCSYHIFYQELHLIWQLRMQCSLLQMFGFLLNILMICVGIQEQFQARKYPLIWPKLIITKNQFSASSVPAVSIWFCSRRKILNQWWTNLKYKSALVLKGYPTFNLNKWNKIKNKGASTWLKKMEQKSHVLFRHLRRTSNKISSLSSVQFSYLFINQS